MVTYLPRSAWEARPSKGPVALNPSQVVGVALHWPGMAKPINATGDAGMRRVASALRGWQNYHMDVRGWSDIAYQIAIDQAGRAWTLRGRTVRSGANGDAHVNLLYGAFLLILAPGEHPSAAMIATTKAVLADFKSQFPKTRAKPYGHRDVRPDPTDCPGPLAYAAIQAGTFTPGNTPPPPAGDEDMPDINEIRTVIADELNKQDKELWALPTGTGTHFIADTKEALEALTAKVDALTKQEADRYIVYYNNLRAVLSAVAADDANDVTQADVERILTEVRNVNQADS